MTDTTIDFPKNATEKERNIKWKKLAEISDIDFGFTDLEEKADKTKFSVRILLYNEKGEICIIKSEKYGYFQLPGGGIEEVESIIEAATREAKEESGYLIKDIEAIGYTIEHRESIRNKHDWKRDISFNFRAVAAENVGTSYTEEEVSEGFVPIWVNINDVLEMLSKNEGHIESYSGNFSNRRDLEIVKSVIESM